MGVPNRFRQLRKYNNFIFYLALSSGSLSSLLQFYIVTEALLNRSHLTFCSYQQIAICVAYSCLADFERDVSFTGSKYEGRYDFFMSVFIIGWVVVLFVFLVFLFAVEGKITTEKNWNIIVSILL